MVADHSKANDDLKSVAEKDKITLPAAIPAADQALCNRLSKLSETGFDTAYIAAMKKDHTKDIQEFQTEADSGKKQDVKDFAARTLPVVKMHM